MAAGKTRPCPHCRAIILASLSVCPACRHHLRFDPQAIANPRQQAAFRALHVEGGFAHPQDQPPWEYSVVISVCDEQGEELQRKVIDVGAVQAGQGRTITLSVEVFTPKE